MAENLFKKAELKNFKLKIGVMGASGSGKTYSSLLLARGIAGDNGKIALVDTENGSSFLYSNVTEFDAVKMNPPYLVDKYIKAIENAVENKYDVLVIDTISQEWAGEGGLLEQKSEMDERGGNQFSNWRPFTKQHTEFLSKILNSDIHIICNMRVKQDYAMSNDNGKIKPVKMGLAPVQREGVEYEFSILFDIDMQHRAQVALGKARTKLFDGRLFTIDIELGKSLARWAKGEKLETV